MRIAIIGSGISGLTCAYVLNQNHEITLFEKNDYIGGHTHTHDIEYGGENWSVDSGFIVYNERTYPNFIKLLDKLGIERQLTRMGFSVKSEKSNLEYAGHSLNGLFAQRSNIFSVSFLRMLKSMKRFNAESRRDLHNIPSETTLGEYLKINKYSNEFIHNYIIPIGAAIWSTVPSEMMEMPAVFFIKFFDNHGLLQILNRPRWFVIKGGSRNYVEKMVTNFKSNILLSTPVKKVKRQNDLIKINFGTEINDEATFDAVIFATHSDQALKLLDKPTSDEKKILGAMKYQKNHAILHYDDTILPNRKLAWSSWNYFLDRDDERPVMLTYNMNILQGLNCDRTFCVTLNGESMVHPEKVIKHLEYEHPLFTSSSIKAQKQKNLISGKNNTFYCGAYWRNGFHEDGVVSALDVCSSIGESF
tara:strand:+ start:1225 stop:2475 length:1251 start_codon:yes stop_codon:yes gene_type:complete